MMGETKQKRRWQAGRRQGSFGEVRKWMEGYKIVRGSSTPPLSDMLPYPSLPFFLGVAGGRWSADH
jgi:hypothetical protein